MTIEENKQLVRRYYEDAPFHPEACDEIFAPKFRFHTLQHASLTPQVVESSPVDEKEAYAWLKTVWRDWGMTIDEMLAESDRVMVRWTAHGVHQGEFHGLPATYQPVTYSGINIFRLAEGKIAEVWDISDRLWLWQQLGVIPDLKEAIACTRSMMQVKVSPAREQLSFYAAQPSDECLAQFTALPPEERLALYMAGADGITAVVASLPEAALNRPPSPGAWTIRQIVHHLVDGEGIWSVYILMALGVPGLDTGLGWYPGNEAWAEAMDYAQQPVDAALTLFQAQRSYMAQLLSQRPDRWEQTILLDGHAISILEMVCQLTRHAAEHVEEIRKIMK